MEPPLSLANAPDYIAIICSEHILVSRWAGWALVQLKFGLSVNPILAKRGGVDYRLFKNHLLKEKCSRSRSMLARQATVLEFVSDSAPKLFVNFFVYF